MSPTLPARLSLSELNFRSVCFQAELLSSVEAAGADAFNLSAIHVLQFAILFVHAVDFQGFVEAIDFSLLSLPGHPASLDSEVSEAIRQGKQGYLCPGGRAHYYGMWIAHSTTSPRQEIFSAFEDAKEWVRSALIGPKGTDISTNL